MGIPGPQNVGRATVLTSRFLYLTPISQRGGPAAFYLEVVSKQEFDAVAREVTSNYVVAFPKMVKYKNNVQRFILDITTQDELSDIIQCRINQGMVDKLCAVAKRELASDGDVLSLYCAAMAVATIIKEYDWGEFYLTDSGLWDIANRIQRANVIRL